MEVFIFAQYRKMKNQAFKNRVMNWDFVWETSEVQVFGVENENCDLGHFPCATDFSHGLNLATSELSFLV